MREIIGERLVEALDLVYGRVDEKPGRVVYVVPGTSAAWDDCCQGQLTARLVSLTPVIASGQARWGNCGISYWEAIGEIMLLRCALTVDDQGYAPSPDALTMEGMESLEDSDVIVATLTDLEWVKSIRSWVPQGPQGGCRGILVTFSFDVDNPSVESLSGIGG